MGVKKHVGLELSGCLIDCRMLMNGGVVHQDYNLLSFSFFVDSEFLQRPMKKVVEYHMIGPSLSYLS